MTSNNNKKRAYAKPSIKVFQLDTRQHLLSGSPLPIDNENTTIQYAPDRDGEDTIDYQ